MRPTTACILALAFAAAPSLARADDKADCFDAAEKAQHLRNDKKLSEARPALITCSRDICPQQVRADCVKWLGETDTAMSTVVVRARDAEGHDLIDVRVLVDGNVLLPKLQGTSVPVDPGQHKFRYEFANGKVVEDDVLIAEGEKDRVIRIELKDNVGGGATGGTGNGGGGGEEKPATKGGGPGPVPWIIGSIGVASFIGFAIMEIPIQSQYSSLQSGCGMTHSCTQDQLNSLTSLYAPAAVLLGVGIAGIVVGGTWLIVAAATGHKNTTTGFGVSPLVGGGAYAGFTGAF